MQYMVQCRCGQKMTVDDAQVGVQFGCVNCGHPFVVPPNPLGSDLVPLTPPPAQPPAQPPPQQTPFVQAQYQPQAHVYVSSQPKNAGLAAVLSFLYCGLGQIYNGQIGKGIGFLFLYSFCLLLCLLIIGFILAPVVWIIGIIDAYSTAEGINRAAGYQALGGPRAY